ncbi:MAG: hypothetical protein IJX76_04975 [Clostridia bacterium]|nr:hypothetical protein [Clostridia bacterium]
MKTFIAMIAMLILSVTVLFAGFVLIGYPDNGGWDHVPLAGCMIGAGVIGTLVFAILSGVTHDENSWRW